LLLEVSADDTHSHVQSSTLYMGSAAKSIWKIFTVLWIYRTCFSLCGTLLQAVLQHFEQHLGAYVTSTFQKVTVTSGAL